MLGDIFPTVTGGSAWQIAHLSPHLPSLSSAARLEQPSPVTTRVYWDHRSHPWHTPGSLSFPVTSIHPPSLRVAGILSPNHPVHGGHHLCHLHPPMFYKAGGYLGAVPHPDPMAERAQSGPVPVQCHCHTHGPSPGPLGRCSDCPSCLWGLTVGPAS